MSMTFSASPSGQPLTSPSRLRLSRTSVATPARRTAASARRCVSDAARQRRTRRAAIAVNPITPITPGARTSRPRTRAGRRSAAGWPGSRVAVVLVAGGLVEQQRRAPGPPWCRSSRSRPGSRSTGVCSRPVGNATSMWRKSAYARAPNSPPMMNRPCDLGGFERARRPRRTRSPSSAGRSCCPGRRHQANRPVPTNDQPIKGRRPRRPTWSRRRGRSTAPSEADEAGGEPGEPEADQRQAQRPQASSSSIVAARELVLGHEAPGAAARRSARPSPTSRGSRSAPPPARAILRGELRGDVEAVEVGELDVEQDDVRAQPLRLGRPRSARRPPRRRRRSRRPPAAAAPWSESRRGRRRLGRSWTCGRLSR